MKGRQPLSTLGTVILRDPDQPIPLSPAWDCLVAEPLTRSGIDMRISTAALAKGRFVCVSFHQPVCVNGYTGKNVRVLRFHISGIFKTGDCISLHVHLPREVLDRAAGMGGLHGELPDSEISPQAGQHLRELVLMGTSQLEQMPEALRGVFARNLEKLLALRWAGAVLEQLPQLRCPPTMIGRRKLTDLISWIRSDHEEPPAVSDLANYCGLGIRALEKNFSRYLDISPTLFLRNLRLDKARELLLAGGTCVTKAALDAGFVHLGRFAAQYRSRFGESPSTTAALAAR